MTAIFMEFSYGRVLQNTVNDQGDGNTLNLWIAVALSAPAEIMR